MCERHYEKFGKSIKQFESTQQGLELQVRASVRISFQYGDVRPFAYQRIAPKQGNMTEGTDGKTIDGMSIKRIET